MHNATKRRMAALAGLDPESYFAPGEPPPKDDLTDADRLILRLAMNSDFVAFMREMERQAGNPLDALRTAKTDREVGVVQGKAEAVSGWKRAAKAAQAKLERHHEQMDAWRKSRAR